MKERRRCAMTYQRAPADKIPYNHETEAVLDKSLYDSVHHTPQLAIDILSRLRRKLEQDPSDPKIIKTVWGGGYIFTPTVGQE
jgi:DNA-binding response OmpR family regulator